MDKDEIIKQLQEENSLLKNELESTQNHLKKYTATILHRIKSLNSKFLGYHYVC